MAKITRIHLFTDGGSRGNPGSGAIGVVICDQNNIVLHEYSECIGHCTNNQAEYRALIKGLDLSAKYTVGSVTCFCDSDLVVKQLNKHFRIKNDALRALFHEVINNIRLFEKVTFQHVKRTNQMIQRADKLLNDAQNGKSLDSTKT